MATASPVGEKASAAIDVGYFRNWHSRFLCAASHTLTMPSQPPVAKVPCFGWKATALTGWTPSAPSTVERWHLNAYCARAARRCSDGRSREGGHGGVACLLLLHGVRGVDVLDGHAALDGANHVALA